MSAALNLVRAADRAFAEIKRQGHISRDTAQDYRIARQAALEEAAQAGGGNVGHPVKPEHEPHKMSND